MIKTLEEVERGDTIVELTSEELQLWYDLAEVEVEKWINQAETEVGQQEKYMKNC